MRSLLRRAALIGLAGLAACTTVAARNITRSHANEAGMPCSEANRVANWALLRLGYHPETVAAPRPGAPGTVIGHKNSGWSSGTPEAGIESTATVTITCGNRGADFEAQTDEPASLTFKSDFAAAVERVASRHVTRPQLRDRPETGLVISVEPLRARDATAEFGADLIAAGITPVRLKIDNRTDRTYAFTADGVHLVTQEGERVQPLQADTAALAGDVRAALRTKHIADGQIAPRGMLGGYLYFPASAYRRATLVLIDQETEEEEGFSVEF